MDVSRQPNVLSAVRMVETPDELFAFRCMDCAATVWLREPTVSFQSWIDSLATEHLPTARVILRHDDVQMAIARVCDICATPNCVEREMLIGDIAALSHIFAKLMRAEFLQMRLEVVTSNDCQPPDMDGIPARLICTYRGKGTEYALSVNGVDPAHLSTVPTGAPILVRGSAYPTDPGMKLQHRSPRINGTAETRLVLVLDPVTDHGEWHEPMVKH